MRSDFLYNFFFREHFSFLEFSERVSLMSMCYYVQCPLFLSDFNETWIFSTDFRKILKYQISRTSAPSEPSCSMRMDRHTGGRTDRERHEKIIVAFRNTANMPKNQTNSYEERVLLKGTTKTSKCLRTLWMIKKTLSQTGTNRNT